jgi:uncharacterized membrane protein
MLYGGSVDLFQISQRIFLTLRFILVAVKAIITLLAIIFLENQGWFLHLLFGLENVSKDAAFKLGIDSQEKLIV